ncbi:MAG: hypothetical protein NC078_09145 [Ruminococcus sp.]|nr:hypothetical protein [Ruminococcus sp.]
MGNENRPSTPIVLLKGLLGAIVGSIPAMILWVVLGKIGVVAAIAGFFMILGELIAFERFTKDSPDMNLPAAVIICGVVMLVNIYLCERFTWSWELYDVLKEETEITLFDCIRHFNTFAELLEIKSDFNGSLVQSYLFGIIGAAAGVAKLAKR